MDGLIFDAAIEKVPAEGGWHIIRLPEFILKALRSAAGKNGNVPIIATIGNTAWPTTTMSMGEQQWFFAVNAAVRKAEDLTEGATVSVTVAPDFARIQKK